MVTKNGEKHRYFHHGDFSGDVEIVDQLSGKTLAVVPFQDMKELVADYVRAKKIEALEQVPTDPDDVLISF